MVRKNNNPCALSGKTETPKSRLRAKLIGERDAMDPAERARLDGQIVAHAEALPCFAGASAILLYAPVGSEIDVRPLMREAWRRGIPVGLPVCNPTDRTMCFRRATEAQPLTTGAFGIPTPPADAPTIEPDGRTVCVLPALAYDGGHRRLGYGGGYYDRFLTDFPGVTVGVAYERCVLDTVFAEAHDLPVSILVTENGVF